MRPTTWNVGNVLGFTYDYDKLNEHTGRVTYAQNLSSGTLDRSYEYDLVGRLSFSHSGAEARAHVGLGPWNTMDGAYSQGSFCQKLCTTSIRRRFSEFLLVDRL
jgi:hypothetical protein